MPRTSLHFSIVPLLLALAGGCSSDGLPPSDAGGAPSEQPPSPSPTSPSAPLGPEQQAELGALLEERESSARMTAADFASKYRVDFASGLSYAPADADNLSLIQGSTFRLDDDELAKLSANGFVISEKRTFPTFVYGYESIYALDLPLYVSADSILFAVHRSYDAILKFLEGASLSSELGKMLEEMRARLAAGAGGDLGAEARADADLYTAVALALLTGAPVAPVAGADAAKIDELVAGAKAHQGMGAVSLFGADRLMDFSQFEPRGHYNDSPELQRYFRSMMWLGRVDFRFLETQESGAQVFQRRQLEGAYALRALAEEKTLDRYTRIDDTIQAFVGESDYMTLPELDALLADLGLDDAAGLAGVPDDTIVAVVQKKGYGTQRISSHIMINGLDKGTLPLSASFAMLGQRYVVDSHVFSNVVYDRVQGGTVKRMMPSPLDVGFAALGNDQAGLLLAPELGQFSYAPDLHMMRVLVDAHPADFWGKNLYNRWLGALRELSPSRALEGGEGLPGVAKTEAWGRRLLNTQLASWAELRHDTILYAKQSYTGGTTCEFPDAYVDPYPAFYARIAELAEHGGRIVESLDLSALPGTGEELPAYFARLHGVATTLGEMAENQRAGLPLTEEHLAFINQAVRIQYGCGSPEGVEGWYADLFYHPLLGTKQDPTIADVHTQPTDEVGATVGRVLHVGTGLPRLMVVTADPCGTPRAYVGLVSSYFERITGNFERMTDQRWAGEIVGATPDDVAWMKDLVSR
ncbi:MULTISPECIES: DUF3160 domain-containing protein [Sorangium]|uniref:DUF3160 domain-containing protein n=1 Tax=Sorangium cellulosum TaxID=56 RepID=A0A4V0NH94_SORCE|nr:MULTISPECIES: DUF3160 domain-containing protein [Sorangium]AUX35882.1 hypothetical protein SOCE836_080840 [Sorangium cellulosum]WCQ95182.1 hypothetical protein NQZ70_07958 [Sorangium sp. Soce836]